MDKKEAIHLTTQLINAAYEAGIYSIKPGKPMKKHWQEKALKIRDNIVYHLTTKDDEGRACQHKRVYYSVEYSNFYCSDCRKGMGQHFFNRNYADRQNFPPTSGAFIIRTSTISPA